MYVLAMYYLCVFTYGKTFSFFSSTQIYKQEETVSSNKDTLIGGAPGEEVLQANEEEVPKETRNSKTSDNEDEWDDGTDGNIFSLVTESSDGDDMIQSTDEVVGEAEVEQEEEDEADGEQQQEAGDDEVEDEQEEKVETEEQEAGDDEKAEEEKEVEEDDDEEVEDEEQGKEAAAPEQVAGQVVAADAHTTNHVIHSNRSNLSHPRPAGTCLPPVEVVVSAITLTGTSGHIDETGNDGDTLLFLKTKFAEVKAQFAIEHNSPYPQQVAQLRYQMFLIIFFFVGVLPFALSSFWSLDSDDCAVRKSYWWQLMVAMFFFDLLILWPVVGPYFVLLVDDGTPTTATTVAELVLSTARDLREMNSAVDVVFINMIFKLTMSWFLYLVVIGGKYSVQYWCLGVIDRMRWSYIVSVCFVIIFCCADSCSRFIWAMEGKRRMCLCLWDGQQGPSSITHHD
jgi:hypothetical protein